MIGIGGLGKINLVMTDKSNKTFPSTQFQKFYSIFSLSLYLLIDLKPEMYPDGQIEFDWKELKP